MNVIKHAKATEVSIELIYLDNSLKLLVTDNGIGFDITAAKEGNSYLNMNTRACILGSSLDVISQPGKGSTISLLVHI